MLVFTQCFCLAVKSRKAQGAGHTCLREKRLVVGIYMTSWNFAFVARLSPVADVDEAPWPIRVFPAGIATLVAIQPSIAAIPVHVNIV